MTAEQNPIGTGEGKLTYINEALSAFAERIMSEQITPYQETPDESPIAPVVILDAWTPGIFWSQRISGLIPAAIGAGEYARDIQRQIAANLERWREHPNYHGSLNTEPSVSAFTRAAFSFDWRVHSELLEELSGYATDIGSTYRLLEGRIL